MVVGEWWLVNYQNLTYNENNKISAAKGIQANFPQQGDINVDYGDADHAAHYIAACCGL